MLDIINYIILYYIQILEMVYLHNALSYADTDQYDPLHTCRK